MRYDDLEVKQKKAFESDSVILFFDGECSFCQRSVVFLHNRTRNNKKLYFSSLQGDLAKRLIPKNFMLDTTTAILYKSGEIYIKSEAIVQALFISDIWGRLVRALLKNLPRCFSNTVYDLISKNRFALSKNEFCDLSSELKSRIL